MTSLWKMAFERFVGDSWSLGQLASQVLVLLFVSVHLFLDIFVWYVVTKVKVWDTVQDLVDFLLEFVFLFYVLRECFFVFRIIVGFVVGNALVVDSVAALIISQPSLSKDGLLLRRGLAQWPKLYLLVGAKWICSYRQAVSRFQVLKHAWVWGVNRYQILQQFSVPKLICPFWILTQPSRYRHSSLLWSKSWLMESISTILGLNFITRDVIEQLRVKLTREDPEKAIQLLIAFFQDQCVVAGTSMTKGKDR